MDTYTVEELRIPGWAIIVISAFVPAIVYWLIWLTVRTFENDKSIALNTSTDENVSKELHQINERLNNFDGKMDKFGDKIDNVMVQIAKISRA